jgi:hypothetical protein
LRNCLVMRSKPFTRRTLARLNGDGTG